MVPVALTTSLALLMIDPTPPTPTAGDKADAAAPTEAVAAPAEDPPPATSDGSRDGPGDDSAAEAETPAQEPEVPAEATPSDEGVAPEPSTAAKPIAKADPVDATVDDVKRKFVAEPPVEKGMALIIAGGLVGVMGFVQHAVAAATLRSSCGAIGDSVNEPIGGNPNGLDGAMEAAEQAVEVAMLGLVCGVTAGPAITLRFNTPVFLGLSLGLTMGGGVRRGRWLAYRDLYGKPRKLKTRPKTMMALGGSALGFGALIWGVSRYQIVRNAGLANLANLVTYDFSTLHLSAAMSISGAALLTIGAGHLHGQKHYKRLEALSISPEFGPNYAGIGASGRF